MTKSGEAPRQLFAAQGNLRNRRRRRKPEEALTDVIYRALALRFKQRITALDAIIAQLTIQSLQNNKHAKRVLLSYYQRNFEPREPTITVIGNQLLDEAEEHLNGRL